MEAYNKYLKPLKQTPTFPTCEYFHSIAGEGPSVGHTVTFIRSIGCRVFCFWCDTKYSWGGEKIEYLKGVEAFPLIVITGGEPLLHKKEILRFINKNRGYFSFEIETSGACGRLKREIDQFIRYIVSPKFKGQAKNWRLTHKYVKEFVGRTDTYFKFVLGNENDKMEIMSFIKKYHLLSRGIPGHIYIMSEGRSNEEIVAKRDLVVGFCKENNFIYSPRVQVQLWGVCRGK